MSTFWWKLKRNWKDFKRPRPSLSLCLFDTDYSFSLDLFGMFIPMPILNRFAYAPNEMMESWGVSYFEKSIYLRWGSKYKFIHMPWSYDHIRCDVQKPDGTWTKKLYSWDGEGEDGRWTGEYDYRYTLKNGEVQERKATIFVERREWRQWWLKWTPLFAMKRTSIDVHFNGEVGERSGSWKGGCIGCGWDLKPNETPEQALRRMEKERVFN
jgi:hypothetical protein